MHRQERCEGRAPMVTRKAEFDHRVYTVVLLQVVSIGSSGPAR